MIAFQLTNFIFAVVVVSIITKETLDLCCKRTTLHLLKAKSHDTISSTYTT